MDHKYKSLLQNIPTRHIIAAIDDTTSIKLHLTRFRDVDIVNFFVLAKLSVVKSVLDHANSNKLFGKKYAWHVITQVINFYRIPIPNNERTLGSTHLEASSGRLPIFRIDYIPMTFWSFRMNFNRFTDEVCLCETPKQRKKLESPSREGTPFWCVLWFPKLSIL